MRTWDDMVAEFGLDEALIRAERLLRFIDSLDEQIACEDFSQYLEYTGWINQSELEDNHEDQT